MKSLIYGKHGDLSNSNKIHFPYILGIRMEMLDVMFALIFMVALIAAGMHFIYSLIYMTIDRVTRYGWVDIRSNRILLVTNLPAGQANTIFQTVYGTRTLDSSLPMVTTPTTSNTPSVPIQNVAIATSTVTTTSTSTPITTSQITHSQQQPVRMRNTTRARRIYPAIPAIPRQSNHAPPTPRCTHGPYISCARCRF